MKTWRERIAEAKARGGFNEEDEDLVQGWETCFVGEQVANGIVPRGIWYDDLAIEDLGIRATEAVYCWSRRFKRAETILGKIEDRALQLKRQQK